MKIRQNIMMMAILALILTMYNCALADIVLGPNGHMYEVVIDPSILVGDATAAAAASSQFGAIGHLATITSAEEDLFLESIRASAVAVNWDQTNDGAKQEFWIGGIQEDDTVSPELGWYWANGEGDIPAQYHVEIENFRFELPGIDKFKAWDGEKPGEGGAPATDVPGWDSDTTPVDSGVEQGTSGSIEGEWVGVVMKDDPSVYNLTNHVIASGQTFMLLIDARDIWSQAENKPALLQIALFYDDAGTRVQAASEIVETYDDWICYSLNFSADDMPASIGHCIGIELQNVTSSGVTGQSWIGLDNVRLNIVPETEVYHNWLQGTSEPSDGWIGDTSTTFGIEDNTENHLAIGLQGNFGWNDESDGSAEMNILGYIVEYDTSIATRVTGGGWINDSEGERANFGFVAMSQKDEAQPKGQIEFQVGDLNFHSSDYDLLAVESDGTNAEFSGSGKLNGEEGYSFKAWVSDGKSNDTLHIIILDGEDLIYDSGNQPLSGGNITIHIGKAKK